MESLQALEDSLDNLEEVLASLFKIPLFEVTSKLDLVQKAKLQVLLPYVVDDLIFSEYPTGYMSLHSTSYLYLSQYILKREVLTQKSILWLQN